MSCSAAERCGCGWGSDALEAKRPWDDPQTLTHLYHCEGMSQPEIGDLLGCDPSLISRNMSKHFIKARGVGDALAIARNTNPVPFETHASGYEQWVHTYKGKTRPVRISRLAVAAWFSVEAVKGQDAHHESRIPWLNTDGNEWPELGLVPMDPSEHRRLHGLEQAQRRNPGEKL